MSLLTDSSIGSLAKTAEKAQSSLPTAISASSDSPLSSLGDGISSVGSAFSSNFYSNLQILTDTSSIAALASSGASDISNGVNSISKNIESAKSEDNGALDGDDSSSNSGDSSSTSSNSQKDKSSASSHMIHQDKKNWKLLVIPLMLVLPLAL